jgi:hypothetical protein
MSVTQSGTSGPKMADVWRTYTDYPKHRRNVPGRTFLRNWLFRMDNGALRPFTIGGVNLPRRMICCVPYNDFVLKGDSLFHSVRRMYFLDYLYYKYFRFQQRIGNGGIASFMASNIVATLLGSSIFDTATFAGYFLTGNIPELLTHTELTLGSYIVLSVGCYWGFVMRGRHERIVAHYQGESDEQRLRGILYAWSWPLLVFFGNVVGWLYLFSQPPE